MEQAPAREAAPLPLPHRAWVVHACCFLSLLGTAAAIKLQYGRNLGVWPHVFESLARSLLAFLAAFLIGALAGTLRGQERASAGVGWLLVVLGLGQLLGAGVFAWTAQGAGPAPVAPGWLWVFAVWLALGSCAALSVGRAQVRAAR